MTRDKFWFAMPFRVRYAEADQQGLLFNAHYLVYFDTAIVEYFRALPYDLQTEARNAGADFHVVRAVVEYKAPIRFDQEVDVTVRIARLGRSSLTFELAIFDRGSENLLSNGEIVWVNTEQTTHSAVPVPQALRDLVSAREHLVEV
jgi:acyl-CoA thioester hydrolase